MSDDGLGDPMMNQDLDDPRFHAGLDLLSRTGMSEFTIGHSDPEDHDPVAWYALGKWGDRHEVAAGMHPFVALMRLCERVIDGGKCAHCGKPTIFVEDMETGFLDRVGCVYAYDPELRTFRRGCEGD